MVEALFLTSVDMAGEKAVDFARFAAAGEEEVEAEDEEVTVMGCVDASRPVQ